MMIERMLKFTLFLLLFCPPLVFVPGKWGGQWIFVNYREPKLAALQILSWLFLTVFWWAIWSSSVRLERLRQVLRDRFSWFFGFFFLYLCWTARNSFVLDASFYELFQYFTILNLFVALSVLWQDEEMLLFSIKSVCSAFAVVTAIGLYQLWRPIPWLISVAQKWQAQNASTFGYKNPAAQAVLGQMFLLLALALRSAGRNRKLLSFITATAFLAEVFYLATLQSRTCYFAFGVTLLFAVALILFRLVRRGDWRIVGIILSVAVAAGIIFSLTVLKSPAVHKRFDMMMVYLKSPSRFLESDRGIYLRNSINMAEKNRFGVGIGNWEFAYPAYRKVGQDYFFTKWIQVRRAHGDYAQMLGETGWIGLGIFLVVLGWILYRGWTFLRLDEYWRYFLLFQFVALMLIMLSDYSIEMPYHKFMFFTVMSMVNAAALGMRSTGR